MAKLFNNVHLHEISNQSDLFTIYNKFFAFVPTYVRGVQYDARSQANRSSFPEDIKEINTITMNDELNYHNNYQNCLGIIGSGNRNFGIDCYCWTARHYHQKYGIPLIADYEIMGTLQDENHINHQMVKIWNHVTHNHLPIHNKSINNPRLIHLERKYGKDLLGKDL